MWQKQGQILETCALPPAHPGTGTIAPSCPAGALCPPRLLPSPFQHRFGSQREELELRRRGIKPCSPGVDFSAWLRRFLGDLGTTVSQPAAESVTQPRRGSVHGAGRANTGSSAVLKRPIRRPWCQGQPSAAKRRKRKAGASWSGCPSKDEDQLSLLTETLVIAIANRCPEPGAGETPCAGARFANEGKFPQGRFHLWVLSSGHTGALTHEARTDVWFVTSLEGDTEPWEGSWSWGQQVPGCSGGKTPRLTPHCSPGAGAGPLPKQVQEANIPQTPVLGGFMHGGKKYSARQPHGVSAQVLLTSYGTSPTPALPKASASASDLAAKHGVPGPAPPQAQQCPG